MRVASWVLVIALLLVPCIAPVGVTAQVAAVRRVNAPYWSDAADWTEAAIFWFGVNDSFALNPGRNYADVRVAYTSEGLLFHLTVVDYYLWYKENPSTVDDLRLYDAVSVYLDTSLDRATRPQRDDYTFLTGARHWPNENAPQYHRQARGTGTGWDTSWSGTWTDYEAMQWSCDPGPNNNDPSCIDYGWTAVFSLPWAALGRAGPPAAGTVWGLGVQLYDRDAQPPAGYVAPEHWPETFDVDSPGSWGELRFGYADYQPPSAISEGTTLIRAASSVDNTVQDAWIGGGGTCGGGHNGGSEINHGDSTNLFVGTETAPTHFPCFSKSYLRFNLGALPPGKVILSATMTLHLFGHAGETDGLAKPSWVHLFAVDESWEEMSIHWNNAPLARENISEIWVNPYSGDRQNPDWPGDPYTWDATQAVAEAYADGQPVNLAIYSSDTAQHSSKYLISSETDDAMPVEGRPTLVVIWGRDTSGPSLSKHAQTADGQPGPGEWVNYTVQVGGSGQALTVTDQIPAQLSHPSAYTASSGSVVYDSSSRTLTWTGIPGPGDEVTISYSTTIVQGGPVAVVNTAHLNAAGGETLSASSTVVVEPYLAFLPCIAR